MHQNPTDRPKNIEVIGNKDPLHKVCTHTKNLTHKNRKNIPNEIVKSGSS